MTVRLEIGTVLESYVVVEALLERRDVEESNNQDSAVEAIDGLLAQMEGTSSQILLDQHDGYECASLPIGEVDA